MDMFIHLKCARLGILQVNLWKWLNENYQAKNIYGYFKSQKMR